MHVVIVAMLGGFFVLAWLAFYTWFMNEVFYSDFVVENPWMFPVICMPFSLLVGVLVKYKNAPSNLEGSMPRRPHW